MAATEIATHALLIDGEDVARTRSPTVIEGAPQGPEIVRRAAREPEAGTVWIDEHLASGSEMPHGVVEGSGFGKDTSMHSPRKDFYDAVSSR